jgi:hypothetical protein
VAKVNEKSERLSSNREDNMRILRDDELKIVSGGSGNATAGLPTDDIVGGHTTLKKF